MDKLKKLLIVLTSSGIVLALAGQAGAAFKSEFLQIRSARLYHTYNVVLTQDSGSACLQGEDYHGVPPSGGTCSEGWTLETVNGQMQCAPTQAKCDETAPGSVRTKDHSGFWVCWQKCPTQEQAPQVQPGTMPGGQQFGPPPGDQQGGQFGGPMGGNTCAPGTQCGPQFGPPQGGPNQGQGFNPGSGVNGNGPGNFGGGQGGDEGRKFQFNRGPMMGPQGGPGGEGQGGPGGMSEEDQQKFQQQQDERMLKDIKRGLTQMSRGLAPMNNQIVKIEKQGATVPQELKDTITKVTNLLIVVKSATTMDEILAAGFEDLQDWMQIINDGRQTLEMTARWGQTQKQVASQLKKLQKVLDRDRALVAKSKFDLSGALTAFQAAITELQNSAATAADLAKSGDIEGAYNELQDNFFDKMDDVYQNDQVIQTLLHLSKFDKEFQRQLNQMKKTVANLKRKKIDTTEMESLLGQISDKGGEIKALINVQPFDQDAVEAAMNDLQDLTQQLQGLIEDATGQQQEMPWEQGRDQFKQMQVPQSIGNMFTPVNQGPQ